MMPASGLPDPPAALSNSASRREPSSGGHRPGHIERKMPVEGPRIKGVSYLPAGTRCGPEAAPPDLARLRLVSLLVCWTQPQRRRNHVGSDPNAGPRSGLQQGADSVAGAGDRAAGPEMPRPASGSSPTRPTREVGIRMGAAGPLASLGEASPG